MLWNTLLLAMRAIRRNLLRSFLTILGVVIGVAAVITMVTLGNGATRSVSDQISSMGSNLIMVVPGQRFGPGSGGASAKSPRAFFQTGLAGILPSGCSSRTKSPSMACEA